MKSAIELLGTLCCFLFIMSCAKKAEIPIIPTTPTATSFNVVVNSGYGSGTFKMGDTVNIWSKALAANETFATWLGDTSFLAMKNEWRTWFIMPAKDVSVSSTTKSINYMLSF